MCSCSFWWLWPVFVCPYLFSASILQNMLVPSEQSKCYLSSPWISSLPQFFFLHLSLLPYAQSGWGLVSWFPPSSVLSDLQFFFLFFFCLFVFTVTHQLKRTWLNLSLPLLSLSSSFSLPPTSCNRMEQIRESIQCNHDKWVPAVRACLCVCTLVSVCACVRLGQSCWEITNESISCYHISKHCKREGWKDACVNDGWMVW